MRRAACAEFLCFAQTAEKPGIRPTMCVLQLRPADDDRYTRSRGSRRGQPSERIPLAIWAVGAKDVGAAARDRLVGRARNGLGKRLDRPTCGASRICCHSSASIWPVLRKITVEPVLSMIATCGKLVGVKRLGHLLAVARSSHRHGTTGRASGASISCSSAFSSLSNAGSIRASSLLGLSSTTSSGASAARVASRALP